MDDLADSDMGQPNPLLFISNSWQNGDPKEIKRYKKGNLGFELVQKESTQYKRFQLSSSGSYCVSELYLYSGRRDRNADLHLLTTLCAKQLYASLFIPSVSEIKKPVKKTLTDYFYNGASKDSIVTSTEYSFAGLNRTNAPHTFQTNTKVVNSNRDTVCSETRYLTDILGMSGTNTIYKQMYDRNMIAVPLETIRKNKNGIVEAQVNLFRQDTTGNIVPAEQKTLEATYPIANYQNLSLATSETMDSRLTTNIKFERFDNKGLLTQYTKRNQITIVTLWGYNGQYPIAKIEGANYDDVKAILTQNLIDKLSISVSPNIVDLDHRLRSGLSSKTASIYTYTYRPLVGMTSSTAPNGVTTYYDYDAFNRLKRTYIKENNEEKTVQSYDYHYQGR